MEHWFLSILKINTETYLGKASYKIIWPGTTTEPCQKGKKVEFGDYSRFKKLRHTTTKHNVGILISVQIKQKMCKRCSDDGKCELGINGY